MEGSIILNTRLPIRSPFSSVNELTSFIERNETTVGELLIVKTETSYIIYKVISVTANPTEVVENGSVVESIEYDTEIELLIQTSIKNNPYYFRYIGAFDNYSDLQSEEIQSIILPKDLFYIIDEHNGERVTTAAIVDENNKYTEIKIDLEPEEINTDVTISWVQYKKQTSKRIKPIIALRPYTRNGGFALDATTYYNTYNEAEQYVRTSGAVYPGQIIAVDDTTKKKVNIYKVVYGESDSVYKYKLSELASGTSGSGVSQYKGFVDNYDELIVLLNKHLDPNDTFVLSENDLYYVKTSDGAVPYVFTGLTEEDKAWEKVSIGISLATEEQDGFITSDIYKTWITSEEGIYYSPGTGEAEENRFIKFNVTGESDSREIMSADMVKQTILNMISTDSLATLNVEFGKDIKDFVHNEYVNYLPVKIKYKPNGSGDIRKCTILSSYNGTLTLYKSSFSYDSTTKEYVCNYNIPGFIALLENDNTITFTVDYDYNEITMQDSGSVSVSYNFGVYKQMCFEYGKILGRRDTSVDSEVIYEFSPENNKEDTLMKVKQGETYTIKTPANKEISYVSFFTPYVIKEAEFYEQRDTEFLKELIYEVYKDDSRFYHKYTMRGFPDYPINAGMTFKITF